MPRDVTVPIRPIAMPFRIEIGGIDITPPVSPPPTWKMNFKSFEKSITNSDSSILKHFVQTL
jgi:hypothetical protein